MTLLLGLRFRDLVASNSVRNSFESSLTLSVNPSSNFWEGLNEFDFDDDFEGKANESFIVIRAFLVRLDAFRERGRGEN